MDMPDETNAAAIPRGRIADAILDAEGDAIIACDAEGSRHAHSQTSTPTKNANREAYLGDSFAVYPAVYFSTIASAPS